MGGNAREHLARLESEIPPVYFVEKGMCQEDNKHGEAVKGWVTHTEKGGVSCQSRSDPRHDPEIDEGYAISQRSADQLSQKI